MVTYHPKNRYVFIYVVNPDALDLVDEALSNIAYPDGYVMKPIYFKQFYTPEWESKEARLIERHQVSVYRVVGFTEGEGVDAVMTLASHYRPSLIITDSNMLASYLKMLNIPVKVLWLGQERVKEAKNA